MLRHTMLALVTAAALLSGPRSAAAQVAADAMDLFSLGSGDLSGTYFATARAICDRLNRRTQLRNLRCSPEPTPGSIYNLAMLRDGELEFALVQSDWQRAALYGESWFSEAGPQDSLRSVLSLYPESVTVIASVGSGIRSSADLPGKRVDIGLPSSGRHATTRELMRRLGVDESSFDLLSELSPDSAISELCDGRIDAAIFVTGHPNRLLADGIERCGLRLVSFDGPRIRAILETAEDFAPQEIGEGTYLGQTEPVATWAVYATLVTSARTPDRLVRAVVDTVLSEPEPLGRAVPALAGLDPAEMRSRGLTAPLHPGAAAAFAAAGF